MRETRQYSTLLSTIYDQPEAVGLGWDTHYSIVRCAEWLDVMRERLELPHVHTLAVLWDSDHDVRVFEVIEKLYMAGLLSPVQFIGEHKGTLTVRVAARFYFASDIVDYQRRLGEFSKSIDGDSWPVELGSFDRHIGGEHQCILGSSDEDERVLTYLRSIDLLWGLGTREFRDEAPRAAAEWVRDVHRGVLFP